MKNKKIISGIMAAAVMFSSAAAVMPAATAPFTAIAAGDSFDTAEAIAFGKKIEGSFSDGVTMNTYKINLKESGKVNFKILSKVDSYMRVQIYNINGEYVCDADSIYLSDVGVKSVDKDVYLTKGDYVIVFGTNTSKGDYNFTLTYESSKESFSETSGGINNDIDSASTIQADKKYFAQLAENDTKDVYKLECNSNKTLYWTFNGTGFSDFASFIIYNEKGEKLYSENYWPNKSLGEGKILETAEKGFTKGVYYVVVEHKTGAYNFNFKTTKDLGGQLFTPELLGDVDGDGLVNASDASRILAFYAYSQTGGKLSFSEFLKK